MYHYLPQGDPDCFEILSLPGSSVMPVTGSKNNISHEFEDGIVRCLNISGSKFDVEIQFNHITDEEKEEILDLYHNTSKAGGGQNTFLWKSLLEDKFYVARFLTPLRHVYKPGVVSSIDTLSLRISAYYVFDEPE